MEIWGRKKYFVLLLVILLLVVGFALMVGPESAKDSFNEGIFSFQRLTLAPIIILLSYGGVIFVIFKKR